MVTYKAFFHGDDYVQRLFYASDAVADTTAILSGKVTQQVNAAGSFDFTVTPENLIAEYLTAENYRRLLIDVYRDVDADTECIFSGHPATVSVDDYNNITVTCDGLLSIMASIIVPPFTFPADGQAQTPFEYLSAIITKANEATFRLGSLPNSIFDIGAVSVSYNREIYRAFEQPTSALDLLSRMTESIGGQLVPRYRSGSCTIDWLSVPTKQSQQDIMAGINLISLNTELDTDAYYSGIYAIGAETDGVKLTLPWTDVATVHDTDYYLFRGALFRGGADTRDHTKVAIVQYDDITTQSALLRAVKDDLWAHNKVNRVTSVEAVDVGCIDPMFKPFELFTSVRILSDKHEAKHEISAPFAVTKLVIDLCDPTGSSVVVDTQYQTLTSMTTSGSGSENDKGYSWQAGDSITDEVLYTAGFVTESATNVRFTIPLVKPVTARSATVSLRMFLRQNNKYTHGSSSSQTVTPSQVQADLTPFGLRINAVMASTANAINNESIGVAAFVSVQFN